MRNKFTMLATGLILSTLVSCKKDDSGGKPKNALEGNWAFVSMNAKTQKTQEYTQSGTVYKTVTVSNYTTTNNVGVADISADSIITKGLAYSIATTAVGYDYENGQLMDSAEVPFNFSLPATNSASRYQLIGTDSLYFPQGGFISIAGSGNPQQSIGSGGKYVISGNILTMTMNVNQTSTQTLYGVPISETDQATLVTTLSKQ